ncbi:MAG: helix-turn-helix transcriptional regulator [bacterium]|nr:helix-turn-helix transcriptional regulator [bacterium]
MILKGITIILFNIFPILWYRYFFLPHHELISADVANNSNGKTGKLLKYNFSKREKEIAELILQGRSNKEIEEQLFISLSTVKCHIYKLYKKAGVNSRAQLTNIVFNSGSEKQSVDEQ